MASRFWARYRHSPVLTEWLDKVAYFTKAACAIYLVRENLIEFTVVSGPRRPAAGAASPATCLQFSCLLVLACVWPCCFCVARHASLSHSACSCQDYAHRGAAALHVHAAARLASLATRAISAHSTGQANLPPRRSAPRSHSLHPCFAPPQCVGPSMMPTFNPRGDIALLEHVTVWSGRVVVGDVVLARSAQNPRHMVCKRVLGLEGDTGACGAQSCAGTCCQRCSPEQHRAADPACCCDDQRRSPLGGGCWSGCWHSGETVCRAAALPGHTCCPEWTQPAACVECPAGQPMNEPMDCLHLGSPRLVPVLACGTTAAAAAAAEHALLACPPAPCSVCAQQPGFKAGHGAHRDCAPGARLAAGGWGSTLPGCCCLSPLTCVVHLGPRLTRLASQWQQPGRPALPPGLPAVRSRPGVVA